MLIHCACEGTLPSRSVMRYSPGGVTLALAGMVQMHCTYGDVGDVAAGARHRRGAATGQHHVALAHLQVVRVEARVDDRHALRCAAAAQHSLCDRLLSMQSGEA